MNAAARPAPKAVAVIAVLLMVFTFGVVAGLLLAPTPAPLLVPMPCSPDGSSLLPRCGPMQRT